MTTESEISTDRMEAATISFPFSVEVTVSGDGNMEVNSGASCSSDYIVHDGDDDEPELIPLESCGGSESESSSQDDDRAIESSPEGDEGNAVEESSSSEALKKPMPMHVTANADEVGMIECLSDQFSSLFCPADQHLSFYRCTGDGCASSVSDSSQFPTCGVTNQGSEVFASLNFWLSPSEEEKLTERVGRQPRNRICARSHKASYVKHLWGHWHPENTIPLERSKSMPSEPTESILDLQFDVFYDSDPESEHVDRTTRGKTLIEPKPKVRRSFRMRRPPPIETIYENECALDFSQPRAPRNSPHLSPQVETTSHINAPITNTRAALPGSPRCLSDYHLLHHQNDEYLRQYVHEITNARINLVWHRLPTKGAKRPIQAPVAVIGAFEVGAHLDQLVIQPKFTWSPAYEADLEKRKFRLSGGEPHSVELLSIIRVVKPRTLNRERYPFARLDRTCCVSTNDERFPFLVFEASNPQERDWFVTALKIIVARLASIIIVRDEARLLEFFSPYSAIMSLADGEFEDELEESSLPTPPAGPPPPTQGELQFLSV